VRRSSTRSTVPPTRCMATNLLSRPLRPVGAKVPVGAARGSHHDGSSTSSSRRASPDPGRRRTNWGTSSGRCPAPGKRLHLAVTTGSSAARTIRGGAQAPCQASCALW
jgi:hypothetical protein